MKNTIFIAGFFIIFFAELAGAQNPDDAAKGIIYYKDYSVGAEMATNGFGAFVNIGRRINLYKTKFYQIEIANITNPKAIAQASEYNSPVGFDSPKPFDYGKQNNFYVINASIGMKRLIAEKADKSGVELSLKYMGGVSLGILKPYDLDLIYSNDNTTISYILPQSYAEAGSRFLNPEYIYGASGFTYGLNQVSIVPGIHFKAGLNFDWAKYDDNIRALEVGVALNAYYEKVPIMVSSASNQQIIPELYISFELGKRR